MNNFIDDKRRAYSSSIHFPTLSASLDSAEYNCDVTIDHMIPPSDQMTNSSVSATATMFIYVSSEPIQSTVS